MSSYRPRTQIRLVLCALMTVGVIAAGCSSSDTDGSTHSSSTTASGTGRAATDRSVEWMDGYPSPGTPAEYNKVGVLEVGDRDAPNVLVLEPGTSAGSAYFVPL